MKKSTLAVLAVGGVAAVGTAIYFATKGSSTTPYAAPATQIPPAGVTTGVSVSLAVGQALSVTVPVGQTLSIALPPGGVWVGLVAGSAPTTALVNAGLSGPVTIQATADTFMGSWTLNGIPQTGSVTVTVRAPPAGA